MVDLGAIGAISGGIIAGATGAGALIYRMRANYSPTESALEDAVGRALNGQSDAINRIANDVSAIRNTVEHDERGNVALHHRLRAVERNSVD
jgi:hypothetical protein